MLFQGFILLCGVFFFIVMNMLRTILSVTFPKYDICLLPKDSQVAESWLDLYTDAKEQLESLGFKHSGWIQLKPTTKESGEQQRVLSVFSHIELATQIFIGPPVSVAMPNQLVGAAFVTWLTDGRMLVSQHLEPAAQIFNDNKVLGQTVTGDTLSESWQQHLEWRNQFTVAGDSRQCQDNRFLESLEYNFADSDRLLESGRAWVDKKGLVRPTLSFALQIIKLIRRNNRNIKVGNDPVPIRRLMYLSAFNEQQQQLVLPKFWQCWLFVLSSLLFIVLGGMFFGWPFACLLLAVIMLHEGGHYLAMKVAGYRNVQMLALPLLGGVTIGVEAKPSTSHRAWVSMMGPLPGIILGWGMLALYLYQPVGGMVISLSWLPTVALMLLFINYLNLLPILPFDGGALLQTLLPPRWFIVRIVLIVLGVLLAALVAWFLEIYILAVISLMQLPFLLPNLLVQRRAINKLTNNSAFLQANNKQEKMYFAFKELTELPTKNKRNVMQLIQRANEIVNMFTQEAMKKSQHFLLSAIYMGVFVVPVVVFGPFIYNLSKFYSYNTSYLEAEVEKYTQQIERRKIKAETLSFEQLLQTEFNDQGFSAASEQELAATETRLSILLSDELKILYRIMDGVPKVGILPLKELTSSTQWKGWSTLESGAFEIFGEEDDEPAFTLKPATANWLYMGGIDEEHAYFYRSNSVGKQNVVWLECYEDACTGYASIQEWFKKHWIYRSLLLDEEN